MANALPKFVTDWLSRADWKQENKKQSIYTKDAFKLIIEKSINSKYAIEITKMSAVNVRLLTSDELKELIDQPKIHY